VTHIVLLLLPLLLLLPPLLLLLLCHTEAAAGSEYGGSKRADHQAEAGVSTSLTKQRCSCSSLSVQQLPATAACVVARVAMPACARSDACCRQSSSSCSTNQLGSCCCLLAL